MDRASGDSDGPCHEGNALVYLNPSVLLRLPDYNSLNVTKISIPAVCFLPTRDKGHRLHVSHLKVFKIAGLLNRSSIKL